MATLLKDALAQTEKGKTLVIQAKAIPSRIRELSQVVYDSFPYPIFNRAKPTCQTLGTVGGEDYETALELVYNSRDSEVDWDIAVDYLTN